MSQGDEIDVEIEKGKTLVIRLTAIGETEEDGSVRVFFELNGQPRVISVLTRTVGNKKPRRVADLSDESQIASPLPGVISVLAVGVGQSVNAGDTLLTLEAMKMETLISAPRNGRIAEIAVKPGQVVEAKDLLIVLE